ncbi:MULTISPECIES: hypothetical protein [Staphylococcus]|uniref:hypothetical protein n=1 Tax=Staphylococcus TaxID=1279 RepID=UPI0004452DF5|nr:MULTISPECIES: hypothetical protein [Staphylococcus]HDY9569847.1 hypothetical protein [Staphylococcus argenteus]EZW48578.1 hypothetical protein U970_02644 [Staphylococcus aureus 56824-10]MCR1798123.1 hypothetical protein [Staphylococcus warneri]CFH41542.1 Uncharacterised protein [Staphylococcus aureus]GBY65932.1 hypothetical protein M6K074_2325 [Staphylococcus aureus]
MNTDTLCRMLKKENYQFTDEGFEIVVSLYGKEIVIKDDTTVYEMIYDDVKTTAYDEMDVMIELFQLQLDQLELEKSRQTDKIKLNDE